MLCLFVSINRHNGWPDLAQFFMATSGKVYEWLKVKKFAKKKFRSFSFRNLLMFSEKSTSFSFKIIFIIFLVIILAFKSAYLLTSHSAENGPSGFRSKHLNFFFELCLYAGYWVEFSIFRKCHLRNFEQINFQEIVEFKYINRS